MSEPLLPTPETDKNRLIVQIRSACLRRGWDVGELARRAGISRTTLYNLQRGATRQPRASTLNSIARSLEIDPGLLYSHDSGPLSESGATADQRARQREFDRYTNKAVDEVYRQSPELFSGWTADELAELYSNFGTGGGLTAEGVVAAATRMNQRRETIRRLNVVLETHLAEVAQRVIETLFEMTRPQSNLALTPQLQSLVDNCQIGPSIEPDGSEIDAAKQL
jgi:transcriptional regulator with XRE-family HTH domain